LVRQGVRRKLIQTATALLCNGNLGGFFTGNLYRGPLKSICAPGLNCYSCPGALGACPIGSIQAIAGNSSYILSLYVIGFLGLVGMAVGRAVCAFACPFGLIQELLHKIPLKKLPQHRLLRPATKLKYVMLVVLVLGVPIGLTLAGQISLPAFCEYFCPVGTLEAGLPLLTLNTSLQKAIGALFGWKLGVLIVVVLWAIVRYRPFCRYLCPLGAIYSLFNRVSVLRIALNEGACAHCNTCRTICKMQATSTNDTECIRCGACVAACPHKALSWGVGRITITSGVLCSPHTNAKMAIHTKREESP
jgi:polyferredoxin